jgi:acyl-CoA synthetase (AMP-forming)/AMP-acid ligase II
MTANPIADRLAERARGLHDAPAFFDVPAERRLTYGDLSPLVHAMAETLVRHGLVPGARVIVGLPNGLSFAVVYLAVLSRGGTAVPANPNMPPAELVRLIRKVDPVLVVARPEAEVPDVAFVREDGLALGTPAEDLAPKRRRDPGYGHVLLFTSGTTGEPKQALLSLPQMLYTANAVARHHRLGPGEVGFSPLPLFHVNAQVIGLLAALEAGSGLAVDDRFHAHDFWERVASTGATWVNAVPAILTILADRDGQVPDRIRFVRSASAPLPRPVLQTFEDKFGPLILETYGLTEAASQVASNPLDPTYRKAGSVGFPVGVRLEVVDEQSRPLPAGREGEVRIGGPSVLAGYLDAADDGAENRSFRDGWFYTGDYGYRDEGGYLYLTGRMRELINRGGQKVAPREVEEILLGHPGVLQALVIGVPDTILGEVVQAHVVPRRSGGSRLVAELETLCQEHLGPYKRPTRIVLEKHLPAGPTGKLLRHVLRAQVLQAVSEG